MSGSSRISAPRSIAVTFEKRDWGAGRETWREQPTRHKRVGVVSFAIRRLSNREAKRRMLSGDVLQVYGTVLREK
jgi:hypothetical protein